MADNRLDGLVGCRGTFTLFDHTGFKAIALVASLIAVTVLVKLYDFYREGRLAQRRSVYFYLFNLPNGFWLLLRDEPRPVPVSQDTRHLVWAVPAFSLSILLGAILWRQDWSSVPFAIEHAIKAAVVVVAVVLGGNALARVYRLLGGKALDPMRNPIAAATPAEFWRCWNRPAQQFLKHYVFTPAGGLRRAMLATLVTFGVSGLLHEYVFGIAAGRIQGYQLLFFSLQGCTVVATMRARPSGRISSLLWVTATLVFNLSTSMLFFKSVDAVVPFYWPRTL